MTRRRFRPRSARLGRVAFRFYPGTLARIRVWADGPECVGVCAEIGEYGTDGILSVDLDLSGTVAGRLLDELAFRLRKARGR